MAGVSVAAQDFSHPDAQPNPQSGLIQQANAALSSGDLESALKILTSLNAQTPGNPQILYDLGLTLESLDASAPAAHGAGSTTQSAPLTPESCYRAAIAADPDFAAARVALGLLLARADHEEEAITELTAAVQIPDVDPGLKARALRALARLHENSRPPDPSAASASLLAAIQLSSEQPDDILLAAQIAESAGDLPGAELAYRRYLASPGKANDVQATSALAHVLLAQHRAAEAEALLTPALARDPENPSFIAQLAEACVAAGDEARLAGIIPQLEVLHAKNPANPTLTRLLAHVYLDAGHPNQADPLYASLIAAQGGRPDPTLLDDRAQVLLLLHRPAAAEKLLQQAVAAPAAFPSSADFADAATHLAFAASEIDDPRTTLQALSLRARVLPPSASSLFLEATANDELHQSSKAAELYRQFLAAANGTLPAQETQARRRLQELKKK